MLFAEEVLLRFHGPVSRKIPRDKRSSVSVCLASGGMENELLTCFLQYTKKLRSPQRDEFHRHPQSVSYYPSDEVTAVVLRKADGPYTRPIDAASSSHSILLKASIQMFQYTQLRMC